MTSTPSNDSEDRSDEAFGPFACATARSAARAAGAIDTAAHVTAREAFWVKARPLRAEASLER